nr:hypothetical protein [uncultured Blautia sp.]
MRKRNRLSGLTVLPIVISIASAHYKMLWLIPVAVISMFVLVGTLPFCRKRENLWMFVLTAFCSIPVNWFLLTNFEIWKNVLYSGGENRILTKIVIVEYMMVLTGVEEIILGLLTRMLWRKQYKLYIPVDEEE